MVLNLFYIYKKYIIINLLFTFICKNGIITVYSDKDFITKILEKEKET